MSEFQIPVPADDFVDDPTIDARFRAIMKEHKKMKKPVKKVQ